MTLLFRFPCLHIISRAGVEKLNDTRESTFTREPVKNTCLLLPISGDEVKVVYTKWKEVREEEHFCSMWGIFKMSNQYFAPFCRAPTLAHISPIRPMRCEDTVAGRDWCLWSSSSSMRCPSPWAQ